jgi:hypothetical protein
MSGATLMPAAPAGGAGVTSVFGRTGVVVAETGDYTAAQVGAVPAADLPLSLANGGTGIDAASISALLTALGVLQPVQATAAAGFALQNATPAIISWTAPADSNNHRVLIFASEHITSAITGGVVQVSQTTPDGSAGLIANSLLAGGVTAGFRTAAITTLIVESGSTVTIEQTSAMTAGAATVWAEIWAA